MLITTNEDYWRLCDRIAGLSADETIAIDTETTGVALWTKDVLRGICIGFRGESFYVPITHPDSWNAPGKAPMRAALEACAALPLFHNAPFDFRSLEAGIGWAPPLQRYRDTMVLSWLEDENRRRGLKYLGERFFGEDAAAEQRHLKELMKAETKAEAYKRFRAEGNSAADARLHSETGRIPGKTWATFTAEDIADYAAKDAHLTSRVYEFLLAHPEYAAIEPAVQRQHDVQAAAYRMTRRGIGIDKFRAVSLNLAALNQSAAIAAEFEREYGRDPGSDSEEGGSILRSPKQLGHVIYNVWGLPVSERTDSGKPSTAAAVLESMAGEHPGLDRILEYRRLVKAAQFYDGLLEHVDQDGRVHPGFNVVGTVTGRWTCSDPNLQQIPKASTNKDAKGLFVARPGYELVSFDLKSAELFVAASLAGDDEMMAALTEEGRSFHKETASGVFGSSDEPFYTLAKNLNYGIPYGIGPKRFASYIAKGRKEKQTPAHYRQAKQAIDGHRLAWPALHQAIRNCTEYADLTGRLPLGWPGRFRHFTSDVMNYPVPGYQAFNAAVQGGVAMLVNDVLVAVEAPAAELGAEPLLAVHDSLVFECPNGTADSLELAVQSVSDDVNPFKMRLLWDRKAGV
jgi:DNA polymerase-1